MATDWVVQVKRRSVSTLVRVSSVCGLLIYVGDRSDAAGSDGTTYLLSSARPPSMPLAAYMLTREFSIDEIFSPVSASTPSTRSAPLSKPATARKIWASSKLVPMRIGTLANLPDTMLGKMLCV